MFIRNMVPTIIIIYSFVAIIIVSAGQNNKLQTELESMSNEEIDEVIKNNTWDNSGGAGGDSGGDYTESEESMILDSLERILLAAESSDTNKNEENHVELFEIGIPSSTTKKPEMIKPRVFDPLEKKYFDYLPAEEEIEESGGDISALNNFNLEFQPLVDISAVEEISDIDKNNENYGIRKRRDVSSSSPSLSSKKKRQSTWFLGQDFVSGDVNQYTGLPAPLYHPQQLHQQIQAQQQQPYLHFITIPLIALPSQLPILQLHQHFYGGNVGANSDVNPWNNDLTRQFINQYYLPVPPPPPQPPRVGYFYPRPVIPFDFNNNVGNGGDNKKPIDNNNNNNNKPAMPGKETTESPSMFPNRIDVGDDEDDRPVWDVVNSNANDPVFRRPTINVGNGGFGNELPSNTAQRQPPPRPTAPPLFHNSDDPEDIASRIPAVALPSPIESPTTRPNTVFSSRPTAPPLLHDSDAVDQNAPPRRPLPSNSVANERRGNNNRGSSNGTGYAPVWRIGQIGNQEPRRRNQQQQRQQQQQQAQPSNCSLVSVIDQCCASPSSQRCFQQLGCTNYLRFSPC